MEDILSNSTFAALVIGGFIGFMIGKSVGGPSEGERNYFRDETSKKYIECLSSDGMAKVSEALSRGRKIEAIKYFREDTSVGLKEAKEAVEFLMRDGPA